MARRQTLPARLDDTTLARAALLYYEQNLNQQEIAGRLNVSSMTVSRLLDRARQRGIVEIRVHAPFATVAALEDGLVHAYELKQAMVLANPLRRPPALLIEEAAAFVLETNLRENRVLGIASGRTVAGIVGQLKRAHFKNLHVVQLMGGVGGFAYINPYNILQTACEKLHAQGTYFEAPAYASSVDAARSLGREIVQTSALPDLWRKCDLAVLGVGAAGRAALHVESGFIAAKEVDAIRAAGGVGDMLGRYFTREGRFLDLAVNKRAMAMPLDDLRRIPIVMTAGYGPEKLEALRGALRTGCLDVLVTDDATATALLSPRGKVGN